MEASNSDIVVTQQNAARPPPIALGINVEKPKFPQYAVYAKRMESFDAWPEYLPVQKDDLVEAGLVYTTRKRSVFHILSKFPVKMSENSDIVVIQQHAARPPPIALGINVEKPKFPQYAVYAKRMESFDAWPEYLPVQKDDLVEAGLVYTGVGDSVRCYFCGGGLRNWEQDDVPMKEHAKWYPKCPLILLVNCQAYVEKLSRGERPEEDCSSIQTDSAVAGPNHLESIAAHSCIQNGYSKEMVKKAIDIFINRYGNSDFKAKDLCQILFELEEEPQESSPCVPDNVEDSRIHIPTAEEELESEEIHSEGYHTTYQKLAWMVKGKAKRLQNSSDLTRVPTEKDLVTFAEAIGENSRFLGLILGLSDAKIDQIFLDNQTTVMKSYNMLRAWVGKASVKPTVGSLIQKMKSCRSVTTDWDHIEQELSL